MFSVIRDAGKSGGEKPVLPKVDIGFSSSCMHMGLRSFYALVLRPGGMRAPQIGGFWGSVAFLGVFASSGGLQKKFLLWALQKAIIPSIQCIPPL